MSLLKTLRYSKVRCLVLGQLSSGTGDEIYKATLMLLATQQMGERAGYLSALESATVLTVGLLVPNLAGQASPIWILRLSQWAKTLAVASLVGASFFAALTPWLLGALAFCLAVVSVYYEPSLQRVIPDSVDDSSARQDANVAVEITRRLAAIVGPGAITAASFYLATPKFFFMAMLAFAAAAISFGFLAGQKQTKLGSIKGTSSKQFWIPTIPVLRLSLLASVLVWGFWALVFQLGLPLTVREQVQGNVAAVYGTCLSAYGFANVIANGALGWVKLPNNLRPMWLGIAIMGTGFLGIAFSQHYVPLIASICLAACGGPLSDLAFLNLMQIELQGEDLENFYRLRMGYANGVMLLLFASSPTLFAMSSVKLVIALSAAALFLIAVGGYLRERGIISRTAGSGAR